MAETPGCNITCLQYDANDGLTITVDPYDAWANAFNGAIGQNGAQPAGLLDMTTNATPAAGQSIAWVQVYTTNVDGPSYAITPYAANQVDNASDPSSPLYVANLYNQRGFFDAPGRQPNFVTNTVTWSGEVYLAFVNGNNVSIDPQGVQWGWTATPVTSNIGTVTTVTSSTNPSTPKATTNLTATVTPVGLYDPSPTETVTFYDATTLAVLATVPVQPLGDGNGSVQAVAQNVPFRVLGAHNVQAIYNGDDWYQGSVGTLTQTVRLAPLQLNLNGPGMNLVGQPVTLTASLSGMGPDDPAPTGTVEFTSGGVSLGTGTVTNGQASITTSTLPVGDDTISAVYCGDDTYDTATASTTETVADNSTTTSVGASETAGMVGDTITLWASVMGQASPMPTGLVTFYDGTTAIGTDSLTLMGEAQLTIATLTAGTHQISAVYSGDGNYVGGTSDTLTITLNPGMPMLMPNVPMSASVGQPFTLSAMLCIPGPIVPTGTVTFTLIDSNGNAVELGSDTVDAAGQVSITATIAAAGSYEVEIDYSGDANFLAVSTTMSLSVS